MRVDDSWRKLASNDIAVLVLWATAGVLLHTVTNGQYGFHRDELACLKRTEHRTLPSASGRESKGVFQLEGSQRRILHFQ